MHHNPRLTYIRSLNELKRVMQDSVRRFVQNLKFLSVMPSLCWKLTIRMVFHVENWRSINCELMEHWELSLAAWCYISNTDFHCNTVDVCWYLTLNECNYGNQSNTLSVWPPIFLYSLSLISISLLSATAETVFVLWLIRFLEELVSRLFI